MQPDCVFYLARVISKECMQKLNAVPENERQVEAHSGYQPRVEHPGIYAALVTKQTHALAQQTLFPGDFILLLDAQLLRDRKDYHFNVSDQNGFIGIDTLYPWNLLPFVESGQLLPAIERCGDDFFGTEIVFHNPLPWSSVVTILTHDQPLPFAKLTTTTLFSDENLPFFALIAPPSQILNYVTKDTKEQHRKQKQLDRAQRILRQGFDSDYLFFNRQLQNINGFISALSLPP